jgi:hypothetical protein
MFIKDFFSISIHDTGSNNIGFEVFFSNKAQDLIFNFFKMFKLFTRDSLLIITFIVGDMNILIT